MGEIKLTQEELDKIIAERTEEVKKGLFTEDELNKRVVAEVDRRVDSGIKKGLETQRKKWEEEFEKKAKMTAEELAKAEYEEKFNSLSKTEKEIKRKANTLEAREMLSEAGVPKKYYEKFMNVLISEDDITTKNQISSFIEVYNETKNDIETNVKSQFTKVTPPKQTDNSSGVTKETLSKMTYSELLKFKKESPDLYKQLTS